MGQRRRQKPERLAEKLLEIRKRLGLSQVQMAEGFKGLKPAPLPGMISRYETGQREPSLLVLLHYSRLANVSMEVLVDDSLKLPPESRRRASKKRA